ncbi:MAG: dephospho-CoA kinase [Chlorobiales bacterium]|nr:dephospho-CoA kinase [Chlorobiales bacterium]
MTQALHLIGVTGGIGSGKSEVCRMLASFGCRVFSADVEAKLIQENDPEVIAGIRELFGDDIYTQSPEGKWIPDRQRIAKAVFSSPEKLDALNKLIHPKVFAAFEQAKQEAKADGQKVLVKEAAILFEAGGVKGLDKIVVVAADDKKRISRAMNRGGLTEAEVRRRMANQWPQDELIKRADLVIYNNGTIEELHQQVEKALTTILNDD